MTKLGKITVLVICIGSLTPLGWYSLFIPALILYWLPKSKRDKILSLLIKNE